MSVIYHKFENWNCVTRAMALQSRGCKNLKAAILKKVTGIFSNTVPKFNVLIGAYKPAKFDGFNCTHNKIINKCIFKHFSRRLDIPTLRR